MEARGAMVAACRGMGILDASKADRSTLSSWSLPATTTDLRPLAIADVEGRRALLFFRMAEGRIAGPRRLKGEVLWAPQASCGLRSAAALAAASIAPIRRGPQRRLALLKQFCVATPGPWGDARVLPPRPERQDHRRAVEGLQPASAPGHLLTDRRRLTHLWKRLPAQGRPVITRANNSNLLTTTTALDQPEPNERHRDRAADIHAVARLASQEQQ